MCAQLRNRNPLLPPLPSPLIDKPLGVPVHETHLALHADVVKELVNKIAWTLGSVYRKPYSNMRTDARVYAWSVVQQVLKDNGYPDETRIK